MNSHSGPVVVTKLGSMLSFTGTGTWTKVKGFSQAYTYTASRNRHFISHLSA